jgi:cbb3-type cytochrome oxidase subunit 3
MSRRMCTVSFFSSKKYWLVWWICMCLCVCVLLMFSKRNRAQK